MLPQHCEACAARAMAGTATAATAAAMAIRILVMTFSCVSRSGCSFDVRRSRNGSQQEHAFALVEQLQVGGGYDRRPRQPRQERRCRLHRGNQDHRHKRGAALAPCRRLDGDFGCRDVVAAGRPLVDEFIVLLVLCLLRTARCIRRAARGGCLHAVERKHQQEEGACDAYSDVLPRHDLDDRSSYREQQEPSTGLLTAAHAPYPGPDSAPLLSC